MIYLNVHVGEPEKRTAGNGTVAYCESLGLKSRGNLCLRGDEVQASQKLEL